MNEKEFEIISIVAARKAEFYIKTRNKLLESLPSSIDKQEAKLRLRETISHLDNSLFIAESERTTSVIDPSRSVSELGLNRKEILEEVFRGMIGA